MSRNTNRQCKIDSLKRKLENFQEDTHKKIAKLETAMKEDKKTVCDNACMLNHLKMKFILSIHQYVADKRTEDVELECKSCFGRWEPSDYFEREEMWDIIAWVDKFENFLYTEEEKFDDNRFLMNHTDVYNSYTDDLLEDIEEFNTKREFVVTLEEYVKKIREKSAENDTPKLSEEQRAEALKTAAHFKSKIDDDLADEREGDWIIPRLILEERNIYTLEQYKEIYDNCDKSLLGFEIHSKGYDDEYVYECIHYK
jgi:hypothetical protein